MASPSGCDTCNKSSLSFLLLRPSPIAKGDALAPKGSENVVNSYDVAAGIIPKRAPTESRVVLRRLRAGYVHIYTPTLVDNKHWHIFRVTAQGDIVRKDNAFFGQPKASVTCPKSEREHNAAGLQLISLPQAHLLKEFWIAFSANLWNDKVRKQNQANPEQMQCISIASGSANTFKPTGEELTKRVLECRMTGLTIGSYKDHDFPFNPVSDVARLAEELSFAAAKHPKTKGKELAIVLRDPVAFATELNALRLLRNEQIQLEAAKPVNAHPLNSSQNLMGLRELIKKDAEERTAKELSWVIPKSHFEHAIRGSYDQRFAGAVWIPLSMDGKHKAENGSQLGRVWSKKNREKFPEKAASLAEDNWEKISDHFDDGKRTQWLDTFHQNMNSAHIVPLQRYEEDWWAACRDAQYVGYFEKHFDENDPNNPRSQHSPGLNYCREAHCSMTPGPLTGGTVCNEYGAQIFADPTKPSSILLRALGANQAAVVKTIAEIAKLNAAVEHGVKERNDKLYDLGAGLVGKIADRVPPKYSWVAKGGGDLMNSFSLGIAQGLIGAASVMALRAGAQFIQSQKGQDVLAMLKSISLIQRTTDLAYRSVVSGKALQTPIVITKQYSLLHYLLLTGGRADGSWDMLSRYMSNGKITVELLTTADEMAAYADKVDHAIQDGSGKLRIPGAIPLLVAAPDALRTARFTDAQWDRAIQARNSRAATMAFWTRETLLGTASVTGGLEGRLALGAVLINAIGFLGNLGKVQGAKGTDLRDATMGMVDAGSSTLAALAQVFEVAMKASVAGRLGEEAVKKSMSIATLRAGGMVLGTLGGIITVVGQGIKTYDAYQANQKDLARLYGMSGLCFLGATVTSGLAVTGAIAERMIVKGTAGVVARRLALRYGAQGVAALMGVSLQGWGLVLLGGALAFEVGAVLLTKSEIQEWTQCTYFGYGKGKHKKFTDWASESEALALVGQGTNAQKQEKPAKARAA